MPSIADIKNCVGIIADEFPIKKIELFGSYANGSYHEKSDVDLLIEFITSAVSLLTLNTIKYRLEELLNTEVDIIHGPLEENAMIQIGKVVSLYES